MKCVKLLAKVIAFIGWYCNTYITGPYLLESYKQELLKPRGEANKLIIKKEMAKIMWVGATGTALLTLLLCALIHFS